MPTRLLTSALIALTGLLLPMTAAAYLTPEQVLEADQYKMFVPTNPRNASQLIMRQDRAALDRHPSILLDHPGESNAIDVTNPTPAEDSSDASINLKPSAPAQGGQTVEIHLDAATVRLLKRLELRGETTSILHGSAPLTPSGPEGWATAIVMIGSVAATMYKARKMEMGR